MVILSIVLAILSGYAFYRHFKQMKYRNHMIKSHKRRRRSEVLH